jgi:hypothetical protein
MIYFQCSYHSHDLQIDCEVNVWLIFLSIAGLSQLLLSFYFRTAIHRRYIEVGVMRQLCPSVRSDVSRSRSLASSNNIQYLWK